MQMALEFTINNKMHKYDDILKQQ